MKLGRLKTLLLMLILLFSMGLDFCSSVEEENYDDIPIEVCDERNYTWSSKYQKCVGLVNSICTNHTTGEKFLCVDNAFCTVNSRLGFGICECNPSYLPTADRTCQLMYGFPCVNQNLENICHKEQNLNCIDGICRCQFVTQMTYDKEFQQCRMLVNEPCHPDSEVPQELRNPTLWTTRRRVVKQPIGCAKGLQCVARDALRRYGRCHKMPTSSTVKTTERST